MRTSLYFLGAGQVALRPDPMAAPGHGQVLIETVTSAISPGTEMLFYRGQVPTGMAVDATIAALGQEVGYPLKYGYACVGRVATQSESHPAGTLVFAFNPHETHFVADDDALLPVPAGMDPATAALLPNMETAVNFLMDARPVIGERVVVFGQGVVGLLTLALLRRFPVAEIMVVDPLPGRREVALAWGADRAIAPEELSTLGNFEADLGLELSGNPAALDQLIEQMGFAGRIIVGSWYGSKQAPLHLGGAFHRQRIRLISSQVSTITPELASRWDKERRLSVAWRSLASIDVSPLISHRIPFEEADQAYRLIATTPEETLQVLLTY
ncbi:MAG: zinc-binding alcohol dehydrogenase [Caldilineaceae bacterium]|nr:zinc-binding alcohol dehydrogenase [Caldilineaceae bacterium]